MPAPGETYERVLSSFRWDIPESYDIGIDACDRHAHGADRLALVAVDDAGQERRYSFSSRRELSNRFANALLALSMTRGDWLGILLPQCPETAIAHLATYKLGGITVSLFTLFSPDALACRLGDSGATGLVTGEANLPEVEEIRSQLPELRFVVLIDWAGLGAVDFWGALGKGSAAFAAANRADDPALVIYTSGTTIFTPIAMCLDFNLQWFAMLVCVNLPTSFRTPPFGYPPFHFKGWGSAEGHHGRHLQGDPALRGPAAPGAHPAGRVPRDHHLASRQGLRNRLMGRERWDTRAWPRKTSNG
jgi:hypothetical protein